MTILLEARGLTTQLVTRDGRITAVDHVNLRIEAGRTLALVGESGSGKSMTCSSLLGLLPANCRVVAGEVLFKGEDLLKKTPRALRAIRGRQIGMVLQDAMTSLNPLLTIGEQVGEVFRYHHGITDRAELRRRSIAALEAVRIPAAADRLGSYPFQFSGGMRQRVAIAINLACEPEMLFCDEPTTALDATVQLQILELLRELQRSRRTTIVFVTHDLRLAARFCDDVAVMYAGRIVERGPIAEVFDRPGHPYTEGLLRAAPSLLQRRERLLTIPGVPPAPGRWPSGCRFAPRCTQADARCDAHYPDWFSSAERRRDVACWRTPERLGAASADGAATRPLEIAVAASAP